ncbi:MAG: phage holin family protein [Phycisphaerae bacterium]|nr:phage holin family protein [Phycisphaerae bacterium]
MNAKNEKQRLGKLVGLMLIAGFFAIFGGGCLKVNANTDVKFDGDGDRKQSKKHRRKFKKDDAYHVAKSIARDAGANPRDYDIHDKKIDKVYWVIFERRNQRRDLGWKNHFAVRVVSENNAKLYK